MTFFLLGEISSDSKRSNSAASALMLRKRHAADSSGFLLAQPSVSGACLEGRPRKHNERKEQLLEGFFPQDKSHAAGQGNGAHRLSTEENPKECCHRDFTGNASLS